MSQARSLNFFLRRDRAQRSGSEAESRAPALDPADHRRGGLEEGFHHMPFFLKAFLSFFVASPSAGVRCGHPSSSSYRCVNGKVEHKKTYAMAFGADGAGRLILITGGVSSAQGRVRARRRSENSGCFRAAGCGLSVHQQAQFLRGGLSGLEAPPVHGKAAGQGHDQLFAAAGAGALHGGASFLHRW